VKYHKGGEACNPQSVTVVVYSLTQIKIWREPSVSLPEKEVNDEGGGEAIVRREGGTCCRDEYRTSFVKFSSGEIDCSVMNRDDVILAKLEHDPFRRNLLYDENC
jgi:hypothetical protein